VTPTITPHVRY